MSKRAKPNKLVIIGDSSVGKTCIIERLITNSFTDTKSTIGAGHHTKTINGVDLDIWDTAGQERFKSMIPMYYKGAKGIIVVYDISDANSFEGAQKWGKEIEANVKGAAILLCGNKCDLQAKRAVPLDVAEKFGMDNGFIYIETSAKDNININKLFESAAKEISKNKELEDNTKIDGSSHAKENNDNQQGGCCY